MAKIDLGDALKKAEGAAKKAESVAKKAETVAKKATGKISESVKTAAEQKKADLAEKKAEKQAEKKAAEEKAAREAACITAVAPQNAVKVFYYLMTIDRKIAPYEEELFDLVGQNIDSDFASHKETLVKECKEQMEKSLDAKGYFEALRESAWKALSKEQDFSDGYITPKFLIWNLLTIACGDDEYAQEERNFVQYLVEKLDFAKDLFMEMESTILTSKDIDRELRWIKETDRPYLVIEKQVKELEKRREELLLSVNILLKL